jgi:hypothetical protein
MSDQLRCPHGLRRDCSDCEEAGKWATPETLERGSFTVRQGGVTVASGSGPYEDIKREAAHYAIICRQDGPVKVSVRRMKKRARAKPRPAIVSETWQPDMQSSGDYGF